MSDAPPSILPLAVTLAGAMIASASAPLLLLDGELAVVAVSDSFCAAFDVESGTAVGRAIFALGNGEWDSPRLRSLLMATVSAGAEIAAYEFELKTSNHGTRCLIVNAKKLEYDEDDGIRLLVAVIDVTDARAHNRDLETLIHEKGMLLQELQHRVANSLQIIASVIMQSARKTASDESRGVLTDAHHRVMSVAAVQRQLAASQQGSVALRPYFNQLCASIGASMIHDHSQLTLDATVDDTSVDGDISVSLGLIVTELVINALKHGFPDGRNGRIHVDYHGGRGGWTLSIADDGVGMPTGVQTPKAGLGTTIVSALARQLKAIVQVSDAGPGTRVTIDHRAIDSAANDEGDTAKAV